MCTTSAIERVDREISRNDVRANSKRTARATAIVQFGRPERPVGGASTTLAGEFPYKLCEGGAAGVTYYVRESRTRVRRASKGEAVRYLPRMLWSLVS